MKLSRSVAFILLLILSPIIAACVSTGPVDNSVDSSRSTATAPAAAREETEPTAAAPGTAETGDLLPPPGATVIPANQQNAPTQAGEIYQTYCASCHGPEGGGTEAGVALNTADVQSKAAATLQQTIARGVDGAAMPGWRRVLEPAEIDALVAYIKESGLARGSATTTRLPTATPIDMADEEAVMSLGAELYRRNCASCHGEKGTGGIGPAINSQQFLARHTDAMIRDAIISGGWRPDSHMPAFGTHLTRSEVEALVQFIRAWEPDAPWVDDPRGSSLIARGYGQGQGRGQGQGQGMGQGPGRGQGQGQQQGMLAQNATPVSYEGRVVSVEGALLTLRPESAADDKTIEVMLGPIWYWVQNGIPLEEGDQIEVEGFDIPDFYVVAASVRNLSSGKTYRARTEEGVPLWRGGGRMSPGDG